jgi:hypothetical protein
MTAKEIIIKKYGTKGLEPMFLTLDIKEIVWLMKEYHKEQLKDSDFCAYCGHKKDFVVSTDINSGKICKNKLCKG